MATEKYMSDFPRRKSIRLKREVYNGPLIIACALRTEYETDMIDAGIAGNIVCVLDYFNKENVHDNLAYCVMPDHLHWMFHLQDSSLNALDQINRFKQKTSYELRGKLNGLKLWQERFYDHIMRTDEDIEEHSNYIFYNPVRKGIVEKAGMYPYSGGEYFRRLYK